MSITKLYLQPLNDLYDTVEISSQQMIQGVISQQAGRRRKDRKFYGKNETWINGFREQLLSEPVY